MPKMKSHSGASKRFKVSGSGKLMRQKAGRRTFSSTSPAGLPVVSTVSLLSALTTLRASSACSASESPPY